MLIDAFMRCLEEKSWNAGTPRLSKMAAMDKVTMSSITVNPFRVCKSWNFIPVEDRGLTGML